MVIGFVLSPRGGISPALTTGLNSNDTLLKKRIPRGDVLPFEQWLIVICGLSNLLVAD
jgi:hypothetical protein